MTGLWNPHAFDVGGQPYALSAPPALRAIGGPLTAAQAAMAQDVFAQFCNAQRYSLVPNPSESGRLPDGTAYRIDVVGVQAIMQVWPVGPVQDQAVQSGILFGVAGLGERWLLVNKPTAQGQSSATWTLRNIFAQYSDESKFDPVDLAASRFKTLRVGGVWRYLYVAPGAGRFGHVNVFVPPVSGYITHVTAAGTVIGVDVLSWQSYIAQFVFKQKLGQLTPPPYGAGPATNVVDQQIEVQASQVPLGTDFLAVMRLPDSRTPYHVSSPQGQYLALSVMKTTGPLKSYLGDLVYAPDYFEVMVDLWPAIRVTQFADGAQFSTQRFSSGALPTTYTDNDVEAQVFAATEAGFVAHAAVPLGVLASACTPTIARLRDGSIEWTSRFGVQISQQFWPYPQRLSRVTLLRTLSNGDREVALEAKHSHVCGFTLSKNYRNVQRLLEGVDAAGQLLTYDQEVNRSYIHHYSRPTVVDVETTDVIRAGHELPQVGVGLISGEATISLHSGSFSSQVQAVNRITRTYSSGLELITYETDLQATHTGNFSDNLLRGSESQSGDSVTDYTSRVASRNVLLRDPAADVTAYVETIVTLTHHSTRSYVQGAVQETHSSAVPTTAAKVCLLYGRHRIEVDVTPWVPPQRYAGYANLGTAITRDGELLRAVDTADLARTEPVGGFDTQFQAQSDLIDVTQDSLLDVIALDNVAVQCQYAHCPETGGMLLEFSLVTGQRWRFLLDSEAGIRDAATVLEWPEGLGERDFFTF